MFYFTFILLFYLFTLLNLQNHPKLFPATLADTYPPPLHCRHFHGLIGAWLFPPISTITYPIHHNPPRAHQITTTIPAIQANHFQFLILPLCNSILQNPIANQYHPSSLPRPHHGQKSIAISIHTMAAHGNHSKLNHLIPANHNKSTSPPQSSLPIIKSKPNLPFHHQIQIAREKQRTKTENRRGEQTEMKN